MAGFVSAVAHEEPDGHKVRGKPERFADHYTQATLFWKSQTPVEKRHIIAAFRFELSRVQTPAVRERMVAGLMNVDSDLAQGVAAGLGIGSMPAPLPRVLERKVRPEVNESPALSLFARPGDGDVRGRRVAILVADGVDGEPLRALADRLAGAGVVARFVATRLGVVESATGDPLAIDATMEAVPSVLFDAVVLPGGARGVDALLADGRTLEFVKDQYRHSKTILALGDAARLLECSGIPVSGARDSGLLVDSAAAGDSMTRKFLDALARHRHYERETDPPSI
jgi:catalase